MIFIRSFDPEKDKSFVMNSWVKNYLKALEQRVREGMDMFPADYFVQQRKICEMLLKRSIVRIACNEENPSQIFGFLIFENVPRETIVHYGYVKTIYRRMGVFNQLLKELDFSKPLCFTQLTFKSGVFARKLNANYSPHHLILREGDI